MSSKNQLKVYGAFFVALFLCLSFLSTATCFADESVVEINNWSDLSNAAKDPTIKAMRLNYDVSSGNTCSISWKVTENNRTLDLNGHSITNKGGTNGDCAMNISYGTGWKDYSLTIKNGALAQDFTKAASSPLLHVEAMTSTATNYYLILQNVDMRMSPSVRVGSAISFERATNALHSRKLEIDGGKYEVIGNGAISFRTYTSSSGNAEYSIKDRVVLKRMQIENIASANGYAMIFYSSNNINKSLSSVIHAGSELYDGESLVTDLSPVNYSSRNVLTIRLKRAELPDLAVSLTNWAYGDTPNAPEVTGNLGSGSETFFYRLKGAEDWSPEVPTAVGDYELKLNVAQTENYLEGEATTEFSIIERADPTVTGEEDPLDEPSGAEVEDEGASKDPTGAEVEDGAMEVKSPDTGSSTKESNLSVSTPIIGFCAIAGVGLIICIIRIFC